MSKDSLRFVPTARSVTSTTWLPMALLMSLQRVLQRELLMWSNFGLPLRDHRNMAKTSIIESACAVLVLPLDVGTFAGLRLHTSKTLTFTYPLRKKPFPTVPVWAEEMK